MKLPTNLMQNQFLSEIIFNSFQMSKIQRRGVALRFISVLLHHAIAIMSLCTALVEKVGLTTGQSGLERENFKFQTVENVFRKSLEQFYSIILYKTRQGVLNFLIEFPCFIIPFAKRLMASSE